MLFSEYDLGNTWLETHSWEKDLGTGHFIVPVHGCIPNLAMPMYKELMEDYLGSKVTGLVEIDPTRKMATGIHFVLEKLQGEVIEDYVRVADIGLCVPVNPEDGARFYKRLSECAASYTDDPENFFEAFAEECRKEGAR